MGKRKCRRRVKAELKVVRGAKTERDKLRARWAAERCWACGRCPGMLLRLAAVGATLNP